MRREKNEIGEWECMLGDARVSLQYQTVIIINSNIKEDTSAFTFIF